VRFTEVSLAVAVCAALAACAPSRPRVPTPAPQHRPAEQPRVAMPEPARAASWDQYRIQAARRLVMANPANTYLGAVPDELLAIPVLEIEVDADGDVRHIKVLRYPGQALDTVQIAMEAVRRAAPFGDVSRLPRPWRFAEVFLFDGSRRFKPRTLDVD
jgi:protein TonB